MKRAIACLIDSAIIETIFKLIVSGIVTHNTPYTGGLLSISLLVFHAGYFFLADWGWDGCSIGKKLTGIRTIVPPDKRNIYLATHGTLKTIFLAFFPITMIYYIIKKRLPYDAWYGITVVKK